MTKPRREIDALYLRSLARGHTEMAVRQLCGIAQHSENDGARVAACIHLLDRGWGKAEQVHQANVDATINVVVRQILAVSEKPKIIEHNPKDNSKV